MAPASKSTAALPGSFPQNTQLTAQNALGGSTSGLGRGRIVSSGVQSRRSATSLGLGVSFAPMADVTSRPKSASPVASPDSMSPRSSSPPVPQSTSSIQSRRSSLKSPLLPPPTAAAAEKSAAAAQSSTRSASRRPSISHLASFLSGIEHHTRVRNPAAGRGVSRSASRSQSRAGEGRHPRRSGGSSGGDTSEDDDGADDYTTDAYDNPTMRAGATSRSSSVAARSRRSSLSLSMTRGDSGGSGSPHPYLHSLVRENTTGATPRGARSAESLWAEDNDEDRHDEEARDEMTKERSQAGWQRGAWKPLATPTKELSTEMEEEPFLDTAPNSPLPKRSRTTDSYSNGNGLQDVDIFEEGERVGVDVWLEGRGGWVRDCFADSSEGGPGNGIGGPRELEVERRLGEGTYAMCVLAVAVSC